MLTIGVEEEYLLLDPGSGLPVAGSVRVRTAARLMASVASREVEPELLQAQVEIGTPVCESLQQVGDNLTRLRGAVRAAAAQFGSTVAACGAAPARGVLPVPVTAEERYRAISEDAPQLVDEQLINGMHVHVGIPDADAAVGVLNRIRPWLPVLVALGANSPLWDGGDTGFASWRTLVFGRWPVSGPPPAFADAADYRARTRALLDAGTIMDLGQLYWQARLSERYPTIEIRALDVQLEITDAVTLAGIVRALVGRALHDHRSGTARPEAPGELVRAATWQAARHGLDGDLVDPLTDRPRSARQVVGTLMEYLAPELRESGDQRRVAWGVARLLRQGNGAQRQRRAFAAGGPDAVMAMITLRSELR